MKRSEFHYELPKHLIARYPAQKRTGSRLMVLNQAEIQHDVFQHIGAYLKPNDLLVVNNTKVMPARLFGVKTSGGKVEVLIERILSPHTAIAHIKASKSPKIGTRLLLAGTIDFEVVGKDNGLYTIMHRGSTAIIDLLEQHGNIPLPHYMERDATDEDKQRYQTVYAELHGSVAAPTAGLHFDETLLQQLETAGVQFGKVTLHVGAGTFQPVRSEDITEHHMHAEYVEVSETLCEQVRNTKAKGGRVIAVGTTSTRSLESACRMGHIEAFSGDTNLFIYPGYEFQCVDMMITNFHLPESSLMMLVSAFAGHANIMQAYQAAVDQAYRFFSYGDAMLLYKKESSHAI